MIRKIGRIKWRNVIFMTLTIILGTILIVYTFAGAVLQESYRLNPPTEQEIAEDPSLVRYLK